MDDELLGARQRKAVARARGFERDPGRVVRFDLVDRQRRHRLAGHEQLDRLETSLERSVDEILALGNEESELVAPTPGMELAHELQARVRGRSDHETQSIVLAWPSRRASRRRPSGHVSTSSAKP